MSRIGNRKLVIPANVTVTIDESNVAVTGPKGELKNTFNHNMVIKVEDNTLTVARPNDSQEMVSLHGTTNALIKNMIDGVSEGYKAELEAVGVGYKFVIQGKKLLVHASYSHPVEVIIPDSIKVESVSNTEIALTGINKQEVNEFAANIRKIRKPEPYKGKGIRYKGEYVRRKDGKKAA